jgi:hypothetical protein
VVKAKEGEELNPLKIQRQKRRLTHEAVEELKIE